MIGRLLCALGWHDRPYDNWLQKCLRCGRVR